MAQFSRLRDSAPAAYAQLYTSFLLSTQMTLARLGFGPTPFTAELDQATVNAVKLYERSRRLPVTGDPLSPLTLEQIAADGALLTRTDATPPPPQDVFVSSLWDRGYAMAKGPWVLDDTVSHPYAAALIECRREHRECVLTYSRFYPATLRPFELESETYDIAHWDQFEISSSPKDFPCARYVLRLNRVQESVTLTRATLSRTGKCSFMDAHDLITMIVPDSALWSSRKTASAMIDSLFLLTPGARKKLAAARGQ